MIKVNVVDSYWFNDDENDVLSEDGMRKFHTIWQTPMIFDTQQDFDDFIEYEGLEYLDSWYSYPDGSVCVDYYQGEYLEKSVHVIEDHMWHLFEEGTVEYDVVH